MFGTTYDILHLCEKTGKVKLPKAKAKSTLHTCLSRDCTSESQETESTLGGLTQRAFLKRGKWLGFSLLSLTQLSLMLRN